MFGNHFVCESFYGSQGPVILPNLYASILFKTILNILRNYLAQSFKLGFYCTPL